MLQIEAHHSDGRRTGLYTDAWSQGAEDFASGNRIVLEAIGKVAEAFGGKGVYVEDRGGDGQEIILGLDELGVRYIIRQRGDRHVRMIGTSHDKSVRAVAQEVKLKGSIDVWHHHGDGRWELKHLRYGWCGVRWPHNGRIYTLVVVVGWADEPLMLWTNINVDKSK